MATKDTHIIDIRTKGAKKSEKQIGGVNKRLSGLAKQAGLAAAAYFGAQGLTNAIKSSTDAFMAQELAEKKLRFAAGQSTDELIKQAQAIQRSTKFGDEAIIGQQAYVKSLGVSTKQTKEIIEASVDLAAAMGISLESAVMNTTKTLSGMQGELGEKLPAAFKELTAEQLKAGEGIVFIREQFRGTAEEETETLSGAIAQATNAFGDLQERIGEQLAPTIGRLAEDFKSLIEIDPSEEARKEKVEFEALLSILKDVNVETSTRELAINKLKTEYSDYLGDLDIEKARLEDIEKLQTNAVKVMEERITQMVFAEQLESVQERLVRERLTLFENEAAIRGAYNEDYMQSEQMKVSLSKSNIEMLEAEIEEIKNLQAEYREKTKVVVEGNKAETNGNKDNLKTAKELGSWQKTYNDLKKSGSVEATNLVLSNEIMEAKAKLISSIMKLPYPLNIFGAAAASDQIEKLFAKSGIKTAQYGADFVTDGPQMMMVGEGSGPERVQVTPLVDENIDGPQGGMTINIQGSVIGTEEFTEDVLIPQIKEGLRLGGDIGSN